MYMMLLGVLGADISLRLPLPSILICALMRHKASRKVTTWEHLLARRLCIKVQWVGSGEGGGGVGGAGSGVICKYLLAAKAVDCLHMSPALQLKLYAYTFMH